MLLINMVKTYNIFIIHYHLLLSFPRFITWSQMHYQEINYLSHSLNTKWHTL